ncbi:hypothetical protein ACCS96_20935, partial [Rhizobium ruizarguesonis]
EAVPDSAPVPWVSSCKPDWLFPQDLSRLGFAGIDLGPISIGGKLAQFPGGPLPVLNLVKFG